MIDGMLGKKIGMTQLFDDDDSTLIVATVIEAGPCYVVGKRTAQKDGYEAVQLGFEEMKPQRVSKPMRGVFKKAKVPPLKFIKEFRCEDADLKPGDVVRVDIFKKGEKIDVSGISKGKGFAGAMKRHGFSGQPASHGGMAHRRPGSIGQASFPGRVWKGLKMAGRMGGKKVSVQGLEVIDADPEKNLLVVKGSVPGPNGGLLVLRRSVKGGGKVAAG